MIRQVVGILSALCGAYFVLGACSAPVASLRPLAPPGTTQPADEGGAGISVGRQFGQKHSAEFGPDFNSGMVVDGLAYLGHRVTSWFEVQGFVFGGQGAFGGGGVGLSTRFSVIPSGPVAFGFAVEGGWLWFEGVVMLSAELGRHVLMYFNPSFGMRPYLPVRLPVGLSIRTGSRIDLRGEFGYGWEPSGSEGERELFYGSVGIATSF